MGGMEAVVGKQGRNRQMDTGHCKCNCWLAFRRKECCCHSHWGQFAIAALISDVHQAAATNLFCPGSHMNPLSLPSTPSYRWKRGQHMFACQDKENCSTKLEIYPEKETLGVKASSPATAARCPVECLCS